MQQNYKGLARRVRLDSPSLQDNTADFDRLSEALKKELNTSRNIHGDLPLLRKIPGLMRDWSFQADCVVAGDEGGFVIAGIQDPEDKTLLAGAAIDLGTTRVVIRILDLVSGGTIAESSFDNPQIAAGPDILARIHYADQEGGLDVLNSLIINGLNREIAHMGKSCGISAKNIHVFTVAGNTAMTHLFMGIDPRWIIREPYTPAVNKPGLVKAVDMGLDGGCYSRVMVFPNVGSYFGGDLISGILYSGLHKMEDTSILVDVGTNAEVVVGNNSWLMACAGAAGPALEGGVTKMGMMAGPGVIDKVEIDRESGEIHIHTINDESPRGICGSGVIDLAAQLFLAGLLDIRGKLVPEKGDTIQKDGMRHLVVVPGAESFFGNDLTISQADLDSLVRSKAAMYTILETITSTVGVRLSDLSKFFVAGTFGSFIRPESAITIGMLPDIPIKNYQAIGNSSLGGAALALKSLECIDEIKQIRDSITYLELNVNQEFMNRFSAAKFIPHTDPSRFPSVCSA